MPLPSLLHPNESCLFLGYRNPAKENASDIYHSMSHWFESEKFRGVDEVLREAVLQAPTPTEARKIASRYKERCRIDWRSVRARVLKAGFMMAAEQNPDVRSRMEKFAAKSAIENGADFDAGKSIAGLSLSWYAGVMWDASDSYINSPLRILLAAGRRLTYTDKDSHIEKFVGRSSISQVLVPIAKDSSPIGEEFAIRHSLPVRYFYAPRGKFSSAFAKELAEAANQILVLERKGGKQFDHLIVNAKELGKTVRLTLI